jgi:hypothetical protein
MLKVLINILIFLFLWRVARWAYFGVRNTLRSSSPRAGADPVGGNEQKSPLDDLTPYEIEDADFEEVRSDRDQRS